ncbi:MAG: outer membrane lipoprotein carrier protein LolA [Kiloniellales bacterium]
MAADERLAVPAPQLSNADAGDLARIERYLEDLTTLRSRFVQVSSLGDYAEGEMVLDRPGKARFEYDPPIPVLMIARGSTLLYYNKELDEASLVPLSATPLRFLTDGDLSLSRDAQVLGIERRNAILSVTLADKDAEQEGRLTLMFSESPLTLRQWEVVDAEGTVVRVALVEPAFGVEVAPSLFDFGDLSPYDRGGRQRGR